MKVSLRVNQSRLPVSPQIAHPLDDCTTLANVFGNVTVQDSIKTQVLLCASGGAKIGSTAQRYIVGGLCTERCILLGTGGVIFVLI